MADLPVVAVIATHGEERLGLLLNRSLPSVSRQTRSVDLVCIVSDNDPLCEFLELEDVEKSFAVSYKNKVRLLQNERTRGNSGTGSWNTGILEALSTFGENCWVAILDDDDEWKDNHIEKCIGAIKEKADCQWIVSGIIRQGKSGRTEEPLLRYQPAAEDFFATNPGVQGSNMFVRCSTVLRAGLFDEKLSSSTDRDLCVRSIIALLYILYNRWRFMTFYQLKYYLF